jgi:hypothetical protein
VAAEALSQAKALMQWYTEPGYSVTLATFISTIYSFLSKALVAKLSLFDKGMLQRMFFEVQSSDNFITSWSDFKQYTNVRLSPVLYQHITDKFFRKILRDEIVASQNLPSSENFEIKELQTNALRLVQDVVRQVLLRIEEYDYDDETKADLLTCGKFGKPSHQHHIDSIGETWLEYVDHGGLCRVANDAFFIFYSHWKRRYRVI